MTTEQAGGIIKALPGYTGDCRIITVNMSRSGLYNTLADSETDKPDESGESLEGSYTGSITELFAGRPDCPVIVMSSAGMTDERMARHFGRIGKNLDNAYRSGKFTKEEYDALNGSLNEYMDNIIGRNDQTRATRAIMQQEWKDRLASKDAEDGNSPKLSPEEINKNRAARIAEYIKENGIDRKALRKMSDESRAED